MRAWRALLAACALLAPVSALAQDPLVVDMRVHVGADGKVIGVEPDPAVPAALHPMLRNRVSQWQFSMPMWQGHPVSTWTSMTLWLEAVPTTTGGFALRIVPARGRVIEDDDPRKVPVYPESLMIRGIGGVFVYDVAVAGDGTVGEVRLLTPAGKLDRDQRKLDASAREAILDTRWEPTMVDGNPVACRHVYPYVFAPDGQDPPKTDVTALREAIHDLCPQAFLETEVIGTLL